MNLLRSRYHQNGHLQRVLGRRIRVLAQSRHLPGLREAPVRQLGEERVQGQLLSAEQKLQPLR